MFRESLSADAKNAFMLEFPNPGRNFPTYQWRPSTGGSTMDHQTGVHGVPIWVRLVRSGNTFTGYWAMDTGGGTHGSWNQLGAESFVMRPDVYVGLALTSHNNTQSVTATFDHVQIIPAVLQISHMDVSAAPGLVTAGTPFDITVKALDPYNNVVTDYTGTVHFTSADPYGASLPNDYTFLPTDHGVRTFPQGATFYTAGTWDVTSTDTVSGISGAVYVHILAGPAVAFQVIAPDSAASGTPFDVTVGAVDPYGNTDANYTGTIQFTTSDPDGGIRLPKDYTFQAGDAGMVTFPRGVTLITLGDQTITVTDNSGFTGNATVTVVPGDGPGPSSGPLGNYRAFALAEGRPFVDPRGGVPPARVPDIVGFSPAPTGERILEKGRSQTGATRVWERGAGVGRKDPLSAEMLDLVWGDWGGNLLSQRLEEDPG
jgi:hypothetical protein